MSVELPEGSVWVEVTSHRARGKLAQSGVINPGTAYGVWPDDGWPWGEFYMVPREVASAIDIKGAKVRVRQPRGRMFRRI